MCEVRRNFFRNGRTCGESGSGGVWRQSFREYTGNDGFKFELARKVLKMGVKRAGKKGHRAEQASKTKKERR
jgi:hypothetical protein